MADTGSGMAISSPEASALRDVLPRVLPFTVYIVLLAVGGFAKPWLAEHGYDARLWYLIMIGATALTLLWALPQCEELKRAPRWLPLLRATALGVLVFVLWIVPSAAWMRIGTPESSFMPIENGQLQLAWAVARIAGMATVVPLIEELFWRSFLQRRLEAVNFRAVDPAMIRWGSIALVSAAFATEHQLWFAGLIAGLLYGGQYRLERSLWYPVIAHAVTNLILGIWIVAGAHWEFW